MMKKNSRLGRLLLCLSLPVYLSCTQEVSEPMDILPPGIADQSELTRAPIYSEAFDWKDLAFMPGPVGYTPIPAPWGGQGNLTSIYGEEVMKDRYPADGWEMVYHSFHSDPDKGALVNPFFVLYNKYNGLIRFYYYLTTEFVATSAYMKSTLSYSSSAGSTSMLSFLGQDVAYTTESAQFYHEILPTYLGNPPLGTQKWYMSEYEMAYDPNVTASSALNCHLNWALAYTNVTDFQFDGSQVGELTGVMGSAARVNNIIQANAHQNGTRETGAGSFSGIGAYMIASGSASGITNNSLGLSNSTYSTLNSMLNVISNVPFGSVIGSTVKVLSGIFKKSAVQDHTQFLHTTLNTSISLTGSGSSSGALPGMPVNFIVPGSQPSVQADGYHPIYNQPLGVVGFTGTPQIDLFGSGDYSEHVIINPAVSAIARVRIITQDILTYYDREKRHDAYGIRYTIEVAPHDGSSTYRIVKTLYAGEIPRKQDIEVVYMNMSSDESDFDVHVIDRGNNVVYRLHEVPYSYLISFDTDTQIWLTGDYYSYGSMYGFLGASDISFHTSGGIRNYYVPGPSVLPGKYRVIFQYNGYYYAEEVLVDENGTDLVMVDCTGTRFWGVNGSVNGTHSIYDWYF